MCLSAFVKAFTEVEFLNHVNVFGRLFHSLEAVKVLSPALFLVTG